MVAAAREDAGPSAKSSLVEVLLEAFSLRLTDGYAAAAPKLGASLEMLLATDLSSQEIGRWLSLSAGRNSNIVALELWDEAALATLAGRQVEVARDTGALGHLQFALTFLARSFMLGGELGTAELILDEAGSIAEATGNQPLVSAPMVLAAWRGDEDLATYMIETVAPEAAARKWSSHNYARAVLCNGLGRHEAARDAALEAMQPDPIGYGSLLDARIAGRRMAHRRRRDP